MRTFLLFLLCCLSTVVAFAQPYKANSFTTNAAGRIPALLATSSNPLYPIMVENPDGTGTGRDVLHSPYLIITGTNATFGGNILLNGRTNRLSISTTNTLLLDGVPVASTTTTNTTFNSVTVNNTTNIFNTAKGAHLTVSNSFTILTNATLSLQNLPWPSVLLVGGDGNATNATLSGLSLAGTTLTASGGMATSGSAYGIVGGSAVALTNGLHLLAAYVVAKAATPHGAALATANRYTILLLPGVYDLGSSTLTLDTQFIDIVGISDNAGQYDRVGSGVTDFGDTIIKSSTSPITVTASPNDLTVANLALLTTTDVAILAYSVNSSALNKLINITLGGPVNQSMSAVNYAGQYVDVRTDKSKLFRAFGGNICSGFFLRCKGAGASFGSVASGTFIDCSADGGSFGPTTVSGTFVGCREVVIDGTGGGIMAGTFSGTAQDCSSTANLNYSSGTVRNCTFATAVENRGLNIKSSSGLGSTDTTAAVSIAATGWTNTFTGKSAQVDFDGTAMTWTVYNSAGTALYTNAVALTGGTSRNIQAGGKIIISGTGVTGRATPF